METFNLFGGIDSGLNYFKKLWKNGVKQEIIIEIGFFWMMFS